MIVLNTLGIGKMSSVLKSGCELDVLALRGNSRHLMTPRCSDQTITVVPRLSTSNLADNDINVYCGRHTN